jgi:hypothetical protein
MLEYRISCGHIQGGWCSSCIELWREAYDKGKKDASIAKKGYMCKTEYECELGIASGGCRVFSSIEDIKNHKSCWKDCGIVEVEINYKGIL